jgi:hypothetical protein
MIRFKNSTDETTSVESVRSISPKEWSGFNAFMENVKTDFVRKEIESIKSADKIVLGKS